MLYATGLALAACGGGADADNGPPSARDVATQGFVVIGHQGASGELPSHTLEGYERAIQGGADYVEPDLAMTADGVLIALHGVNLEPYTDVAQRPEFQHLRRTRRVGSTDVTGYFAADFTLAEIKQLRVVQFLKQRSQVYNGLYQIPTLSEIIALVKQHRAAGNTRIGIAPELILPSWYANLGLDMESTFLKAVTDAGWTRRTDPVLVQSFDLAALRRLRGNTDLRLLLLIESTTNSAAQLPTGLTSESIRRVAPYVDALGVWKGHLIVKGDATHADFERPEVVKDATANKLSVYVWTLCREAFCRPERPTWTVSQEFAAFRALGVRGVFDDHPADAAAFRDALPR